jgi:hypothetical protein
MQLIDEINSKQEALNEGDEQFFSWGFSTSFWSSILQQTHLFAFGHVLS